MRLSLLFIVNLIPFLAVDRRHHRVDCVQLGVVDPECLGPTVAVGCFECARSDALLSGLMEERREIVKTISSPKN